MQKVNAGRWAAKTAGHEEGVLYFEPSSEDSWCGNIHDAVIFELGNTGGWVIAYADLLEMAELARAARPLPPP